MMRQTEMMPLDLKVLSNHIYELQKGVRQMVLFTCPKQYEACTKKRLCSQNMDFVLQSAGKNNLNFYIGRKECLNAIRLIVTRPLNELTPEEDFILGTMLGYDLCAQCERYCERCKKRNSLQAKRPKVERIKSIVY
jgi:hypothetical protein